MRLAYVTVVRGAGVIESIGGYNPGRNELRVVAWPGMTDRVVVRDMPATVRQQFARERVELGHALQDPFWDSAGASVYAVAAIVSVPDATLYALERADAAKGGAIFVSELANISGVAPAPNGRALLADMSGLGSAPWFEARATTGDQAAWRWAATKGDPLELRWHSRPAWAPDSRAVVYPLCEPRYGAESSSTFCTLTLLTPQGGAALVPSASMERVDWGRDE